MEEVPAESERWYDPLFFLHVAIVESEIIPNLSSISLSFYRDNFVDETARAADANAGVFGQEI